MLGQPVPPAHSFAAGLISRSNTPAKVVTISVGICVRNLNWTTRNVQHPNSWARAECEGRDAAARLVVRQGLTVGVERANYSAAAVVDYERPFASRAVVEIAMRFEQAGELVENLDREYVLGRRGR